MCLEELFNHLKRLMPVDRHPSQIDNAIARLFRRQSETAAASLRRQRVQSLQPKPTFYAGFEDGRHWAVQPGSSVRFPVQRIITNGAIARGTPSIPMSGATGFVLNQMPHLSPTRTIVEEVLTGKWVWVNAYGMAAESANERKIFRAQFATKPTPPIRTLFSPRIWFTSASFALIGSHFTFATVLIVDEPTTVTMNVAQTINYFNPTVYQFAGPNYPGLGRTSTRLPFFRLAALKVQADEYNPSEIPEINQMIANEWAYHPTLTGIALWSFDQEDKETQWFKAINVSTNWFVRSPDLLLGIQSTPAAVELVDIAGGAFFPEQQSIQEVLVINDPGIYFVYGIFDAILTDNNSVYSSPFASRPIDEIIGDAVYDLEIIVNP